MKKLIIFFAILNSLCFILPYTCLAQIPTAGLIGEWTFTGNANDGSGNSHHGTVYGGATLTTDRFGSANSAYDFNGTDAFIELGDWFNYQEFSISLWVNRNNSQNDQYVDIIDNNHTDFRSWTIQERYGNYSFGFPGACTLINFTLTDNTWIHLVITRSNTENKLYLDGDLIVTAPCSSTISYDGTQHLGLARFYYDGSQIRFWKGKIDDVLIYNRALSANEVSTLYRQGVTFTGGGVNNNFSNPANWSGGIVPPSNLDIIIAHGATMVVDMDYTCKTLTINSGASFSCTGGHTLTITKGVYDENGKEVIDINSSLVISSGLKIPDAVLLNSGTFTDSRDGKIYNWVKVGTQIWMAENLAYNASGSWAYNNDEANVATYGRLYDWPTAMAGAPSSNGSPSGVQGVCPSGWHLPSLAEFQTLSTTVGNNAFSLAGVGTGATNSSGFSALFSGMNYIGSFLWIDSVETYWTSYEVDPSYAWYMQLWKTADYILFNKVVKSEYGWSVRCVKD